jgi:iron complex transport system ATP-binding protein
VLAAVHDLDLAARYADRLLIMDRGRIAADGDPVALLGDKVIGEVFGIERRGDLWHALAEIGVRPADPRSLP